MTLRIDPTPIPLGTIYPLPGGVTVWQFPPLGANATDEEKNYRRRSIATLDLLGHRVIETMQELAEILNEAQQ